MFFHRLSAAGYRERERKCRCRVPRGPFEMLDDGGKLQSAGFRARAAAIPPGHPAAKERCRTECGGIRQF
jgi:hypothetical protein